MSVYWSIEEGPVDPAQFFRAVPEFFPDATTLCIEGTSIEEDVKAVLAANAQAGTYLADSQTIWPTPEQFRCTATPAMCEALAQLCATHALPEICDHVSVYRGSEVLLEFPDFCFNEMFVSAVVPESTVSAFALHFGLPYRWVDDA